MCGANILQMILLAGTANAIYHPFNGYAAAKVMEIALAVHPNNVFLLPLLHMQSI
jgi:hypothetical protein